MRAFFQTGSLLLGVLCLLYYAAIVLYAGLSADFAWIWVIGGAFFLAVNRGLVRVAAHPASWLRYLLIAAGLLAAAGILVCVYIGAHIASAMFAKPEQGLDCVIVLGAQVRGSTPSRALRKRLDCAAQYAEENPETIFFLSGGKGSGEDITEAECMRRYLVDAGIDESRLILEDRSTSTKENLEYSNDLGNLHDRRVGVLSNDFHVYRASRLAARQGYAHVFCIPAPSDPGMQPHYILREICAVLASLVFGQMTL